MREKLFKCIGREDLIEDHRVHLICDKHFSEKQKFIFRSMNRTNLNADLVPDTNLLSDNHYDVTEQYFNVNHIRKDEVTSVTAEAAVLMRLILQNTPELC